MEIIQLNQITKIYQNIGQGSLMALDKVSFSIEEPGMYFILGPSGCGKSTLLNIIGGLDTPTNGEILIDGISTKKFTSRSWDKYRNRHVGFVFQDYGLIENYTIYENIELALELQHIVGKKKLIKKILEELGLTADEKRKPKQLSGGQKQRVAIARAIIKNPEILLADEPTGNLDSKSSKQIFEILKEYSKQHIVIIVSHSIKYAEEYADQIIKMCDGRIIEHIENIKGKEELHCETKEKNDIQLKGLSFKKILEFATKNIIGNLFRYITTIILFVTMAILASVGVIANRYEREEVRYNTIIKSGLTNVEIGSSNLYKYEDNETNLSVKEYGNLHNVILKSQISNETLNEIKKINGDYYPIYNILNTTIDNTTPKCGFLINIQNEENLQKLGFNIVQGRFPKYANEVMITDVDYKNLYENGNMPELPFEDTKFIYQLDDYSSNYNISIVGIVDTGYEEIIESAKKTIKMDENYNKNLEIFIKSESKKRYHHAVYVNDDFMYFATDINSPYYLGSSIFYYLDSETGEKKYIYDFNEEEKKNLIEEVRISKKIITMDFFDYKNEFNNEKGDFFFIEEGKSRLEENEILISIGGKFDLCRTPDWWKDDYNSLDISYNLYKENRELFNYNINEWLSILREHDPIYCNNLFVCSSEGFATKIITDNDRNEFKIAGYYAPPKGGEQVIVSNNFFDKYFEKYIGISAVLYNFNTSSKDSCMSIMNYLDNDDEYSFNHLYNNDLEIADERAKILKNIGIQASILLGICGILLMYSMMINMINNNTRQLGIYRALGASKTKIMTIYIVQGLFLCCIAFGIASVFLPIVADYIQGANGLGVFAPIFKDAAELELASSKYSIKLIDILEVKPIDYLYMAAFCIVSIMSSTIIPTLYKLNKKPIDLLRQKK